MVSQLNTPSCWSRFECTHHPRTTWRTASNRFNFLLLVWSGTAEGELSESGWMNLAAAVCVPKLWMAPRRLSDFSLLELPWKSSLFIWLAKNPSKLVHEIYLLPENELTLRILNEIDRVLLQSSGHRRSEQMIHRFEYLNETHIWMISRSRRCVVRPAASQNALCAVRLYWNSPRLLLNRRRELILEKLFEKLPILSRFKFKIQQTFGGLASWLLSF